MDTKRRKILFNMKSNEMPIKQKRRDVFLDLDVCKFLKCVGSHTQYKKSEK